MQLGLGCLKSSALPHPAGFSILILFHKSQRDRVHGCVSQSALCFVCVCEVEPKTPLFAGSGGRVPPEGHVG